MKLYLVRHGEADSFPVDAERPLSERGIAQVENLAQHFALSGVKPAYIYHSGLLRAQQTAQIIAEKLDIPQVEKIAYLGPEDPTHFIREEADLWDKDTMLVGHMPYMPILLRDLIKGIEVPEFHTATGVCLEKQGGKWVVVWVFHGGDE